MLGLWSGKWYRVRAPECLAFALTITTLYGVTEPHGPVPHAIFSTKDRRPFLRSEEIRNEIYA